MRRLILDDYTPMIERMRVLGMLRRRWDHTPNAWAARKKPAALSDASITDKGGERDSLASSNIAVRGRDAWR